MATTAKKAESSDTGTTLVWPADVKTLAIDVGGTGLKASVLDSNGVMIADRIKVATPYPCPPEVLIKNLKDIAAQLPTYHRVSVGFPGLVRHGRVYNIPALSRLAYGGVEDPNLAEQWHNYDLAGALAKSFAVPTKVANDADVQGCAVVKGEGFEFVMTLGTGCGTALFSNGKLLPHLELGHAPFRTGKTFEDYLGNSARKAQGNKKWAQRVAEAIKAFDQFLFFDAIYIGGGNGPRVADLNLGPKVTIVPNTAGILGGIRIWELDETATR